MKKLISCCSLISMISMSGISLGSHPPDFTLPPLPYEKNALDHLVTWNFANHNLTGK